MYGLAITSASYYVDFNEMADIDYNFIKKAILTKYYS